jgi:hypothetical protein
MHTTCLLSKFSVRIPTYPDISRQAPLYNYSQLLDVRHGREMPSLTEITRFYSIQTPDEFRRFLTTYGFLVSFLSDAIEPLRQYFPSNALILSVQTDPDTCVQNLILSIDIQNDPEQAMQRLDQMDALWWFNVSPKIRDLVLITLSAAG